jgi:hypothetical protein
MVKDAPPPPHLSTRAVLAIGICSDTLAAFLYYAFVEVSFTWMRTYALGYKLLGLALMLSILFGVAGTLVGSVMWARRAASGSVIMAVGGVILSALIYGNRVKFGFDDPKVLVIPFAILVVISLFIGGVMGRFASNRQ